MKSLKVNNLRCSGSMGSPGVASLFLLVAWSISSQRVAVDKSVQSNSPILCSWFYSVRDRLQSHLLMLRAIVHQIIEQEKSLFHCMAPLYRQHGPNNVDPFRCCRDMLLVLDRLLSDPKRQRPMLCIFDGLDGSYRDGREEEICLPDVLNALSNLVAKQSNFKVILLSRPDHDIKEILKSCGQVCMQESNSTDILHVIDNRGLLSLVIQVKPELDLEVGGDLADAVSPLENEALLLKSANETLSKEEKDCYLKIKQYLKDNADVVFLWVTTIIATLKLLAAEPFCDLLGLEEELCRLPQKDLDDLYADIVKKIGSSLKTNAGKVRAKRAIIWTAVNAQTGSLLLPHLLLAALLIEDDIQRALLRSFDPLKSKRGQSLAMLERELQRLRGPL